MYDAVFIVGPDDGGNNYQELRYALRSLDAHVNHRHVWIIGRCPDWVADVWHINVPQTAGRHGNVRNNLYAACAEPRISDPFMLWQDDIMATRLIGDLPVLNAGPLEHVIRRARGAYRRGLEHTHRYLRQQGIHQPIAYDGLHVPQWYDKVGLTSALDADVPMYATVFGNLHRADHGDTVPDAKARTGWLDRAWVSTSADRWAGAIGEHVRLLYPQPCRYEQVSSHPSHQ